MLTKISPGAILFISSKIPLYLCSQTFGAGLCARLFSRTNVSNKRTQCWERKGESGSVEWRF